MKIMLFSFNFLTHKRIISSYVYFFLDVFFSYELTFYVFFSFFR
jgi:hypothetical protein